MHERSTGWRPAKNRQYRSHSQKPNPAAGCFERTEVFFGFALSLRLDTRTQTPARLRLPNKLVDLELKTRGQPVFEHPFDDAAGLDPPENGTEQDGLDAIRKLVARDLLTRPLVILA